MVVTGTYDPYLVALSILVASFASYTALDLGGRVGAARGLARRIWLLAAAITMGAGIWSMHFIGMLAFIMPMPRKAAIIKEANSSAKEAESPGEHERLSLSALLAWQ
jgi:NO-binding membrane sensor protein with MHYT domain